VVVVFQPAQVRAYGYFHLRLAKNDKIDAGLIADATAATKKIHAAPDARLEPFAEHLTMIEQMGEVIGLLIVKDIDARDPEGQVVALRRFLDVTSREVLQRLKWSIESVRRSLLDESVTMLHRQTKLRQLDLGALSGERTPELASGASESQLRGYVMLISAKLPLVRNVKEFATLAADHLENVALGRTSTTLTGRAEKVGPGSPLAISVTRLAIQLDHWQSLMVALGNNVSGLEDAIEHAWRENSMNSNRCDASRRRSPRSSGAGSAGRAQAAPPQVATISSCSCSPRWRRSWRCGPKALLLSSPTGPRPCRPWGCSS